MRKTKLTLIQFREIAKNYTRFVFRLSQQSGFNPCSGARVRQEFDEVVIYTVVPERIIFASDTSYLQLRRPQSILWTQGENGDLFSFCMKEQTIEISAHRQ